MVKCKIRAGRGSAQFADGATVWVNMDEGELRRSLEEVAWAEGRGESCDAAGARVWVGEDPETMRGCYVYMSDLELPRAKPARRRR